MVSEANAISVACKDVNELLSLVNKDGVCKGGDRSPQRREARHKRRCCLDESDKTPYKFKQHSFLVKEPIQRLKAGG